MPGNRTLITSLYADDQPDVFVERREVVSEGKVVAATFTSSVGLLQHVLVRDGSITLVTTEGASLKLHRQLGTLEEGVREWTQTRRKYAEFGALGGWVPHAPVSRYVRLPEETDWQGVAKEEARQDFSVGIAKSGERNRRDVFCGQYPAARIERLGNRLWALYRRSSVVLEEATSDPFTETLGWAWAGAFGPADAWSRAKRMVSLSSGDVSAFLEARLAQGVAK